MKKQEEPRTDAIRIWDIISADDYFPESEMFKLYELISEKDGIVRENPGRKSPEKILFYDVTEASDEFKAKYSGIIHELVVKKIEKILKDKPKAEPKGKIQLVIPYSSLSSLDLSQDEKKALGNDFYKVTTTEEGIKFTVLYTNKGPLPDELYLRVAPDSISPELYEKIAEVAVELLEQENGLYINVGGFDPNKQL